MAEIGEKRIEKGKAGLIVSAVLIVILVSSNVWSYVTQQNWINILGEDKNNLQVQLDSLNTTYQEYVSIHSHNNSEYAGLSNENLLLRGQIDAMNETLTLFERQTREVLYFRIFSLYNYKTDESWYAWYKIKSADYYNYRFDVDTHAPALLDDRITEELVSKTAGSWSDPESDVIREIAYDLWQVSYGDEEVFVNLATQLVHQLCYNVTLYTKYPIETIVEESGDCDNLAVLTASILNAGGFDVVLLLVYVDDDGGHCMLGVSLYSPPDDLFDYGRSTSYYVDDDGERYWLIEATWGDPGGANWIDPTTSDACYIVGALVGDNPWDETEIVSIIHPEW